MPPIIGATGASSAAAAAAAAALAGAAAIDAAIWGGSPVLGPNAFITAGTIGESPSP